MSPRRDNSPAIGRRNFLKGATLAGTAAAIAARPPPSRAGGTRPRN